MRTGKGDISRQRTQGQKENHKPNLRKLNFNPMFAMVIYERDDVARLFIAVEQNPWLGRRTSSTAGNCYFIIGLSKPVAHFE